jgi:hypothetical protein
MMDDKRTWYIAGVAVAFIIAGHYNPWMVEPLHKHLFYVGKADFDGWSVTHAALFGVFGYMYPTK